jgi:preprotein translocase subunit SecG
MTVLIVFFTTVLLLLSSFVVLIILMQKPNANAGMGSALGGGVAEQAFGGAASNVLTRTTVFAIVGFFVLSFALYLGNLKVAAPQDRSSGDSDLRGLASGLASETATSPAPVMIDESKAVSLDSILDQAPAQPESE